MAPRIRPRPYPPNAPFLGPNGMVSLPWLTFFNNVTDFIATLTQRGLAADQPDATDVYPGTLYFSTDTMVTERSTGQTWEPYSP